MNTLILNRETFQLPEDDWYQLAPMGEFVHEGAGVVQVIDGDACDAMVAAFERDAGEPNFAGLLIDFDHFSLDGEKRSEAAGWIVGLEYRGPRDEGGRLKAEGGGGALGERCPTGEGGLYAQIRWSDVGKDAVEGGRYRFLSPVWSRADCEDLGDGRLRPVRVLNAAVTNDPNLKGMVPLSNRAEGGKLKAEESVTTENTESTEGEERIGREGSQGKSGTVDFSRMEKGCGKTDPAPSENYAGTRGNMKMKKVIEALINRLKLSAEAGEDDVLAAMEKLPSVEDFEALQNAHRETQDKHDALLNDAKGLEEEIVNRYLGDFEGVISDESRPFWTEQLLGNREAASATLAELARTRAEGGNPETSPGRERLKAEEGQAQERRRPLHNRQEARPQSRNADGSPSSSSGSAEGRAVKIRNRAHELVKVERVPFITAFRRAEKEIVGE